MKVEPRHIVHHQRLNFVLTQRSEVRYWGIQKEARHIINTKLDVKQLYHKFLNYLCWFLFNFPNQSTECSLRPSEQFLPLKKNSTLSADNFSEWNCFIYCNILETFFAIMWSLVFIFTASPKFCLERDRKS